MNESKPKKTKEERRHEKHLRDLTDAILICLERLDAVMKAPESNERGKQIAVVANALDMANDQARYFGLSIDYRKDDKARAIQQAKARARK